MRPYATSVRGLKLLVYAALLYTVCESSVWHLSYLVHAALVYAALSNQVLVCMP